MQNLIIRTQRKWKINKCITSQQKTIIQNYKD